MDGRREHFSEWAASYDADIGGAEGFPFEGYAAILDRVVTDVDQFLPRSGSVVDLGVGTGSLAARVKVARDDATLHGVDFSPDMLEQAAAKVPGMGTTCARLTPELAEQLGAVDVVMATYALHELSPGERIALVSSLFRNGVGALVVGDIGWPTRALRDQARVELQDRWDPHEYYFAWDEEADAYRSIGLQARFEQVSFCAGVVVIEPARS